MPKVELPTGLVSIKDFPRLRERIFNMIPTGKNQLISRPGIDGVANGEGVCRGQRKFQEELYQVSGQKLIKINADFTIDNISDDLGTDITGTSNTEWAVGFTFMVFLDKGTGRSYAWDGSALTEIVGGLYKPARDVEYMNGRWVWIPLDGSPAFFSEALNPLVIEGFFDAETQPDLNSGLINLRNRLYVMGEDTIEPFRDTGTGTVPYQRIEGGSIWTGYVGGKVFFGDTFAFLGKDKDNNFGFFVMASGRAERISNPVMDEILNNDYTVEELQSCLGQRLQWLGNDIAVFQLPRDTFAFNGGWLDWVSVATYREELVLNDDLKGWRANYITHCYGKYYVGDTQTDDIGQLGDFNADYGEDIERGFDTFIRADRGSYFTLKSLEIEGVTGQTNPNQTIGLAMSDDGKTYGDFFYVEMGAVGDYLRRIFWELPGGLGDYESFAGIRIRTTAPVEIACEGMDFVI